MKKTALYITAIVLSGLSSCITDGDFLEYDESTVYNADAIRSSYERTTQYVTDIYSYLPTDFYTVGAAMRSSACDEGEYAWVTSDIHSMTNGQWSPRKAIDNNWSHFYKGIRAVNLYLEEFNNSTFDYLQYDRDYESKYMTRYRNYEYEVRFLRAFFHFELLKRYGRIPLEKHTLTDSEVNNLVPAPFDEAVQFITDECDSIKEHLQPEYGSNFDNEVSRIKRSAAYALKARVLLYAASPLHNPGNDRSRWVKAAEASADMLKAVDNREQGFILERLPFYELVMAATSYATQQEVILATRTARSGDLERNNFPIGVEGGNSGNCPTHNLAEKYGMQTGRTFDEKNPWRYRDPRLGWVIALNGERFAYSQPTEIWEGGLSGLPKIGATKTGYYLKKFLVGDTNLKPGQTSTFGHAFILFRYAEVYLNYAEAVNEAYGPNTVPEFYTKTAIEAANVVRGRRGLTIPLYSAADFDQSSFQAELRDERWRELAFEDHRFWDIRRWKIGAETQRDIKRLRIQLDPTDPRGRTYIYSVETDVNARYWDDKMYLYPIPQDERDKNSRLGQNVGWE
ncbi:RagB/SusD family nutrient uptake outer membrane protein [Viscerimonas tarda]